MARSLTEIEKEIRSLSAEDKAELLRALIDELDAPADPDVERAWPEEAQRRYTDLADGKVEPVSGESVFKKLHSRLRR